MKKIFILFCLTLLLSGATVLAQGGLDEAGNVSGLTNTAVAKQGSVPAIAGYILSQATVYLGIIFFLLIIYSGFTWMTAAGKEETIAKAKGILIAAATGLVIILSAYAIVRFVFGNVLYGSDCAQQGGECITVQACDEMKGTKIEKLCPGDANFKCCIPK